MKRDPDDTLPARVFLLSPASCRGPRGRLLFSDSAAFDLALRLRAGTTTLAEVFAFVSSLYFRGKLGYARAFARPPAGLPGVLVITPTEGIRLVDEAVDLPRLRRFAEGSIDLACAGYLDPLLRDARSIEAAYGPDCDKVLLGSVASGKYVDALLQVFGERLLFPAEFVGRGDMSRGGLLLRCVDAQRELSYVPVQGTQRRGRRPPRLPPRRARSGRLLQRLP